MVVWDPSMHTFVMERFVEAQQGMFETMTSIVVMKSTGAVGMDEAFAKMLFHSAWVRMIEKGTPLEEGGLVWVSRLRSAPSMPPPMESLAVFPRKVLVLKQPGVGIGDSGEATNFL